MSQPTLPIHMRRNYFDPVPELAELRAEQPISRVATPWGLDVWLVTRYEDVRAVFGEGARFDADAIGISAADINLSHSEIRRLLQPDFTARRVIQLKPRIEKHVAEHLDLLARSDKPADFIETVAKPLPLQLIFELLGLPVETQPEFYRLNSLRLTNTADPQAQADAAAQCRAQMMELVAENRRNPNDGMLGRMVVNHGAEIDDDTITKLVDLILLSGYESTTSMLGLGVLLLLRNPEQIPWSRTS
ncbi:hypothetical protein GCM10029964_055740 [Kibdelosporangium lantanae]